MLMECFQSVSMGNIPEKLWKNFDQNILETDPIIRCWKHSSEPLEEKGHGRRTLPPETSTNCKPCTFQSGTGQCPKLRTTGTGGRALPWFKNKLGFLLCFGIIMFSNTTSPCVQNLFSLKNIKVTHFLLAVLSFQREIAMHPEQI